MPRIKGKENAGPSAANASIAAPTTTSQQQPAKKPTTKKAVSFKKQSTTRKRSKAVKDPNAPKRAMSAYLFFTAEKREQVKMENPKAKLPVVSKILGTMWRELSAEEKKPFLVQAEKDRLRYHEEMAAYKDAPPATEGISDEDESA